MPADLFRLRDVELGGPQIAYPDFMQSSKFSVMLWVLYPGQWCTGSHGYRGYRGSVFARPHSRKTLLRELCMTRTCVQVVHKPMFEFRSSCWFNVHCYQSSYSIWRSVHTGCWSPYLWAWCIVIVILGEFTVFTAGRSSTSIYLSLKQVNPYDGVTSDLTDIDVTENQVTGSCQQHW